VKIFEFLESIYVATNVAVQKEYSAAKQGKIMATQTLISWNRSFHKWLSLPILLGHYVLVQLHVLSRPPSPKEIADKIKADAQAAADAAAEEAKKLLPKIDAETILNQSAADIDPKDNNRAQAIAAQLAKQQAEAKGASSSSNG